MGAAMDLPCIVPYDSNKLPTLNPGQKGGGGDSGEERMDVGIKFSPTSPSSSLDSCMRVLTLFQGVTCHNHTISQYQQHSRQRECELEGQNETCIFAFVCCLVAHVKSPASFCCISHLSSFVCL